MDFYKNIDKLSDRLGVNYNQVLDVSLEAVVTEPVTLNEMKDFAKVTGSEEDAILTALITAARDICEKFICQSLVQREVTAYIKNFNGGAYLPYGPVGTITDLYVDDEAIGYEVQGTQFKQILSPLGTFKAVYQGGYATCPEIFKTAIKSQALYMFENRGDAGNFINSYSTFMSPVAYTILTPYKRNV